MNSNRVRVREAVMTSKWTISPVEESDIARAAEVGVAAFNGSASEAQT